jgi:hypothetical protein
MSLALLGAAASSAMAQTVTTPATTATVFDQVEEDWVLVVANPDTLGVGPQITTCMSPLGLGDTSNPFVAFDLNYREYPDFLPGGMQLQVWSSGQVLSVSTQGTQQFATPNERITWTQQMILSGGKVTYNINNGQSTTWNQFGQGNNLSVSFSTTAATLEGYDPDDSVTASGASWQKNNVTSLTLSQVRYYANGQLLWTDTTPRSVVSATSSTSGFSTTP